MTVAATLLDRLAAADIEATRDGDRVQLRGRQPTPDLLAELRARKGELLAELTDMVPSQERGATRQADPLAGFLALSTGDCPDSDLCDGGCDACRAIRDTRLPAVDGARDPDRLAAGLLAGFRRHAGRAAA